MPKCVDCQDPEITEYIEKIKADDGEASATIASVIINEYIKCTGYEISPNDFIDYYTDFISSVITKIKEITDRGE